MNCNKMMINLYDNSIERSVFSFPPSAAYRFPQLSHGFPIQSTENSV